MFYGFFEVLSDLVDFFRCIRLELETKQPDLPEFINAFDCDFL